MTDQMNFEGMVENGGELAPQPELEEEEVSVFALSAYSAAPQMDQSDVFIPRLRLAQGLSAEVQDGSVKPGQWIITGFGAYDAVTVVPILFTRQRRLTDDEFKVLCSSPDSLMGVGTPGGVCSTCPMNQWTDGPKGRRVPPMCTFSYAYIVYVVDLETVAAVEFRRTSIQAGKSLNTMVAQRGIGNFGASLGSIPKQGPKGMYYVASVTPTSVAAGVLEIAKAFTG